MCIRDRNFAQADLNGALLLGASLNSAVLSEANLANAQMGTFDHPDGYEALTSFTSANMSRALIGGADFSGVDMRDVNLMDIFYNENIETPPVFNFASLTYATLSNSHLVNAQFQNGDLIGANFFRSNLTGANFDSAQLQDANLMHADLTGTNFTNANLLGANFLETNMSVAFFSNTTCPDGSFSDGNVDGKCTAALVSSQGTSENFNAADLTLANQSGANLPNVDFSGAILSLSLIHI